jgi:hypothetical protein
MAKRFDEFVNELHDDKSSFMRYWMIADSLKNYLIEELKKLERGDEGLTVTDASTDDDIPGIGKREDYTDEKGNYTHIIIGIRIFYGNSKFISSFNSMTEYGEYLIKFENRIKELIDVKKTANYGDYFCYLIEIDDKLKNLIRSREGLDKFNM